MGAMWWYILGVSIGLLGCQVQPVQRTVPPLLVLERRLQPEPRPSTNSEGSSSIHEPDTAVAGVSVRRLPTIRESMERLAAEQVSLRETLEEVQQDIQRMGLLLAELTELARALAGEQRTEVVQPDSPRRPRARRQRTSSRRAAQHSLPDRAAGAATASAVAASTAISGDVVQRYAKALQHLARREYTEVRNLLESVL